MVEHLAAGAARRDEPGIGERSQVLLHGLARDRQLAGEVGGGRLAVLSEQREEVPARGIAQGAEDGVSGLH